MALGNHTWSHPDVTTLDDRALTEEIRRNQQFLWSTYGVRDTPFFRPPYGAHNARTDADRRRPRPSDDRPVERHAGRRHGPDRRPSSWPPRARWFTARRIVIGHANHRPVTTVFGELLGLVEERKLRR